MLLSLYGFVCFCVFVKKKRRSKEKQKGQRTNTKMAGKRQGRGGQRRGKGRTLSKFLWDSRESQEGFKGKYEVPGVGP